MTFLWAFGLFFPVLAAQTPAPAATPQTPAPAGPKKKKPRKPRVVVPRATPEEIQTARMQLSVLGYWLDPKATGFDQTLRHALIAFQKVEGRKRTGVLTSAEVQAIQLAVPPRPREIGTPHVEIDLTRQVLLMVNVGDQAIRVLPISSGSGKWYEDEGRRERAVTPTGRFKIIRKIKGWRKSTLGMLYFPCYFYNGTAVHGAPSVPIYPASHGCARIPMSSAEAFYKLADIGLDVVVYD